MLVEIGKARRYFSGLSHETLLLGEVELLNLCIDIENFDQYINIQVENLDLLNDSTCTNEENVASVIHAAEVPPQTSI